MKTKFTLGLLLTFFFCSMGLNAQTVTSLFNFEDGTTQGGTYVMAWAGGLYIKAFDVITNPSTTGINASTKTLHIQEESNPNWWDNLLVINLTSPITIDASNRYLHIMHRRPRLDGGGFVLNINSESMLENEDKGKTRFDANLSAVNEWQDIVIDLNDLTTNSVQLSKFCINPDLNDWSDSGLPLGDYYFDEIILSSSPLPRGTSLLTVNNLYDFEVGTAANITGVSTSANADNVVTYPVSNPFGTSVNTSMNVGKRSVIANPQWWTGFEFSFANPVLVDNTHKYLHIMMAVPVDGQKVVFDVKQGATNVIADNPATISTAGAWQDVVIDVSSMAYISGMSIKCGHWDATAVGDYYFDEIYIDGNASPRISNVTGLNKTTDKLNIYPVNKGICIENISNGTNVSVYNVAGQRVFNKHISNNVIIPVEKAGLYLLRTADKTTKVIVE